MVSMPHTYCLPCYYNMMLSSISSRHIQNSCSSEALETTLNCFFAKLIQVWEETFLSWSATFPPAPPFFLTEKKIVVYLVKKKCVLWGSEEPHTQKRWVPPFCCSDKEMSNILLPLSANLDSFFLSLHQALVHFVFSVNIQ